MTPSSKAPPTYVLGHSEFEMNRLTTQARLVDPMTRRFFLEAGLAPGMRVLDVGSGVGDVAFLAAGIVGSAGQVVGFDRSATALAVARRRTAERSLTNVMFLEGEPARIDFGTPFDAVVGRYVLMFQTDPVAMLRAVAAVAKPGAVIVFHECDWESARSRPPAPIHDQCCAWIVEAVKRSGAEANMGVRLHPTFLAAGLSAPTMRTESIVGGAGDAGARDRIRFIADLTISLAEQLEQYGIATAAEIGAATLADRMEAEAAANGSVMVERDEMGAWTRR
jgi:SAM-dependent methyltransferase